MEQAKVALPAVPLFRDVFCKYFLKKIAKYFWRKLHFQIGESCKASAGNYSASHIAAIADRIQLL